MAPRLKKESIFLDIKCRADAQNESTGEIKIKMLGQSDVGYSGLQKKLNRLRKVSTT
jgi:hypothetical protein